MRHEVHACDGVRLPFDTACAVLDGDRHDIMERATHAVLERTQDAQTRPAPLSARPRVVTAALERDGDRAATMAMHWIQADPAAEAEGGLSAWLHCHLRLLPRRAADHPFTQVLLTASCETTPRDPDALDDDVCASFLHEIVTELERKTALERVPR